MTECPGEGFLGEVFCGLSTRASELERANQPRVVPLVRCDEVVFDPG